jgi:hypothetical protein
MRLKFLFLGTFLLLGLFSGIQVSAITESSSILMNIIPANPAPNEDVSITLQSYSEDLDSATISWFLNGKKVAFGIGKKTISLVAPALGLETKVVAQISIPNNESQVTTIIKPAEMVLLWQAMDSYVPPFYKGKALPAPDTFVKVVAMPEIRSGGALVNPTNLVYSWQRNFDNVQDANGYGRNSFTFKNDYLENSDTIGVVTNTTDQRYSSASNVNIRMFSPELSFYRKDSTFGTIWEQALGDTHFIKGADTLVAVPYFISPKDIRRPDLVFNWFINDSPLNIENYKKTILPIAVEEGTSGVSKIKLEIESTDKIFQTASKTINIEF